MAKQIPLDLAPKPDFTFETFEASSCNEAALGAVRVWPKWPSPVLAIIGPTGSGKTHLGQAWAHTSERAVFVDNADKMIEEDLFFLLNKALNGYIPGILLAARIHPADWPVGLPDLKSRLKNIPVARLEEPDNGLLEPIIRKLFEDRGRAISQDVVQYLMKRHDRSIDRLREVICDIDKAAQAQKADITKRFVSKYLART